MATTAGAVCPAAALSPAANVLFFMVSLLYGYSNIGIQLGHFLRGLSFRVQFSGALADVPGITMRCASNNHNRANLEALSGHGLLGFNLPLSPLSAHD